MGWNPNPGDPIQPWQTWEFCILTQAYSEISGGPEIDLIYRQTGDQNWISIGANDGMVYGTSTGTFEGDVARAGSFAAWWAPIEAEINKRLAVTCPLLNPAPVLAFTTVSSYTPLTFAEFQAWMKPSIKWNSAPPVPPVGVYPLYGGRLFFGKHACELGVNADGSPAVRVNDANKGWLDYVPKS